MHVKYRYRACSSVAIKGDCAKLLSHRATCDIQMKAQQILHFIVLYLKYVIEKSITKLHLCAVSTTSLWKTEMVEPRAMYYNIATLTDYGSKMEAAGKQQKKATQT